MKRRSRRGPETTIFLYSAAILPLMVAASIAVAQTETEVGPRSGQEGQQIGPRSGQEGQQIGPRSGQEGQQIGPRSGQEGQQIGPRSGQEGQQIGPRSGQEGKTGQGPAAHSGAEGGWPCVQRKVPELSVAALWTGPEIDPESRAWQKDNDVRELVSLLAVRRTSMEEAEAAIAEFAKTHADNKKEKLSAVFTGLFQSASDERKQIISGIGRYDERQEALAQRIRERSHQLALLVKEDSPREEIAKLQNELDWDTRVFEMREQSLTAVCQSPRIIEQRLYQLSQKLQSAIAET